MKGKCLCGAVTFSATPEKKEMSACHCSMCRRWSGGVPLMVNCGRSLQIDDTRKLGIYSSSEWGERLFCKECGSSIAWCAKDGGFASVSAQCFEDPAQFAFTTEIFVDSQPKNYVFANQTHKMTEKDVLAWIAQSQQEKGK